jgi:predicted RNA binding protein YcfA (HicA-like mRNA interferase family)
MPPKLRQLCAQLIKAGYRLESGKGSHRKFLHPVLNQIVVLSGNDGDDALPYQQKSVTKALNMVKK